MEIGHLVPKKNIFEDVFTIYGHGGHPGHIYKNHFHVPKNLHIKFGKKWPSAFLEKQVLIFICKWPQTKAKK